MYVYGIRCNVYTVHSCVLFSSLMCVNNNNNNKLIT